MKRFALVLFSALIFAVGSLAQSALPAPSVLKIGMPHAFVGQATPPANCSTATGFPCAKLSWSVASCTATPTFGGTGGAQDSGPCVDGVLRCAGNCTAASLPVQTSGALVGNSQWKVLTSTLPQTAFNGTYFDNAGLAYNSTYTYVVVAEYSGAGGGIWSAYSNTFQMGFGQAPQAPLGTPATPAGLTVVSQ